MKRRKYNYGTSAKIETPSEALAQNEIDIAKSQLDSMQNPLIQTTKMLGQLGQMATAGVIPGGEYLQALQQFGQLMAYGGAVNNPPDRFTQLQKWFDNLTYEQKEKLHMGYKNPSHPSMKGWEEAAKAYREYQELYLDKNKTGKKLSTVSDEKMKKILTKTTSTKENNPIEISTRFDAANNPLINPNDGPIEDFLEIFDPTGILSFDDFKQATSDGKINSEDIVESIGMIPMLGKKASKIYKGVTGIDKMAQLFNVTNKINKLNKVVDSEEFSQHLYAMGGVVENVPVEVEGDEVAKTPDGDMLEFKGKKHEEGGIKTNLPEGTEVYSDRIKIEGKTLAKRKTEREKHMMKLQKMLTETFDPLLEKTTLRVKNNNDKIEAFDKKVQGVANEAEKAKQEEERARKIQKQKEEERLRREKEQKEGFQEGEQDPEKESLENREDDSEQETKRIGDKPQGNESDENEDQQQQNEDQPSEGLPKFKYGSFPGDPLALDPSLITNNTLDILGSFQPQSYTPNNPNNYSPIVSNNFEATPFSASENILTDFLELSNSSINNPIISRNPINAPKNTLEERLSKQSKKEDAKNFLKTIGKESLPDLTTGDAMGLAASLAQSFLPLKNTLEERATDRVNENLYQNYGESALRDMEDAQGMLQASFKDQADRLARSKRTQKSQNALSARGISQKRAMNLASEQQFQDSFNQAYSAFNQQLMSMVQGKARFKAEVDQIRTQGAEKADIANRQDKANFYTQRGQDLMSMTEGLQNVAKNLNEAEYRESMEYMLNTLYDKYGIEIDMKGNLGVNKSKTKTPE